MSKSIFGELKKQNSNDFSATGLTTADIQFKGKLNAYDIARNNLFSVKIISPIDLDYDGTESNWLDTLNNFNSGNNASSELSARAMASIRQNAQDAIKSKLGAGSINLIKTGMGEYYNDVMGIEGGYTAIEDYDPSKVFGLMAQSITLPAVNVDVKIDYQQYGGKQLFATNKSNTTFSMVVRCSSGMTEYKYLKYHIDKLYDYSTNTMPFPDSNIFPEISVYIYNRQGNAIAEAVMKNSVLTSISGLEYSYESNNEVTTFTAEFTPKSFDFITYPKPEIGATGLAGKAISLQSIKNKIF